MDIGEKIKYYRKKKELTQKELAHGICSIPYLSKIENKKIPENPDILSRLCERLGITYEQKDNQDRSKKIIEMEKQLDEWYEVIISRDKEKAIGMEKNINEVIKEIEDPTTSIQYQLFSIRYHLLLRNLNECKNIIKDLKLAKKNFSDKQMYYFYYFFGLYKYLQDELIESLEYYSKAERINQQIHINDPELIYLLSLVHSRLHHVTLTIHYANIALKVFNQKMDYYRSIEIQIILAINYIRINKYDKAKEYLQNSLKVAEKMNDSYLVGNIYHNLGYLYSNMKKHDHAIDYYHKSLFIKQDNIEWYTYTLYYLVEEYFASNQIVKAMEWIEKGLKMTDKNDKNHIRIKTLNSVYILSARDAKKSKLEEERIYVEETVIPFFQKKQNWNDLSHYAEKLADFYVNQSHYKKASYYYKLANDSRKKIEK